MTKLDSKRAREIGRKGGRAKARKKLTLERVEEELGSLQSLEDGERWLRAQESKLSRELVDRLRGRLDELEAQIKRSGMGVMP